jgi:hypothetical protein
MHIVLALELKKILVVKQLSCCIRANFSLTGGNNVT